MISEAEAKVLELIAFGDDPIEYDIADNLWVRELVDFEMQTGFKLTPAGHKALEEYRAAK